MAAVMEKQGGVKVSALEEDGVKKAVGAPVEEVALIAPPAPQKEPRGKCYEKTVGVDATFMETAKDYFTQFKDRPAKMHWICFMNRVRAAGEYVSQKSSSVFGKQKVEPVVKESIPEVANKDGSTAVVAADKPATVKSH